MSFEHTKASFWMMHPSPTCSPATTICATGNRNQSSAFHKGLARDLESANDIARRLAKLPDTIGGACSSQVNKLRYGISGTCACRDNFLAAMKMRGMSARDIHANINFFMNVPVLADGSTEIVDG
jgi:uncharacterized protein YcgI (DUF1989 family)